MAKTEADIQVCEKTGGYHELCGGLSWLALGVVERLSLTLGDENQAEISEPGAGIRLNYFLAFAIKLNTINCQSQPRAGLKNRKPNYYISKHLSIAFCFSSEQKEQS
jgi:hypothetical protein